MKGEIPDEDICVDEVYSPTEEAPDGTVYYSQDSSWVQDSSGFQKQKFCSKLDLATFSAYQEYYQRFSSKHFQESFQPSHFLNEHNPFSTEPFHEEHDSQTGFPGRAQDSSFL